MRTQTCPCKIRAPFIIENRIPALPVRKYFESVHETETNTSKFSRNSLLCYRLSRRARAAATSPCTSDAIFMNVHNIRRYACNKLRTANGFNRHRSLFLPSYQRRRNRLRIRMLVQNSIQLHTIALCIVMQIYHTFFQFSFLCCA